MRLGDRCRQAVETRTVKEHRPSIEMSCNVFGIGLFIKENNYAEIYQTK